MRSLQLPILRRSVVVIVCSAVLLAIAYEKRDDVLRGLLDALLRQNIRGASEYAFSDGPSDLQAIFRTGFSQPVVGPKVYQYTTVNGILYVSRRPLMLEPDTSALGTCEVVAVDMHTHQRVKPSFGPNLDCTHSGEWKP